MRDSEKLQWILVIKMVPLIHNWSVAYLIIEVAYFRELFSLSLKHDVQALLNIWPVLSVFLNHKKDQVGEISRNA